jgi:hypothetical protein
MWIFTSGSFVSIVADRDNFQTLLVRARLANHIHALFPKAKVFELEEADYQFRARVSRECAVKVIAKQVEGVGYPNFKNTVQDPRYHQSCMEVWGVMHRLQGRAKPLNPDLNGK